MPDNFVIETGPLGPRVVVTGPWTEAIAGYIRAEGIPGLYLNYAKGWKGDSIDFLRDLPGLRDFALLDLTITDVSPVHALKSLESLEVCTYCSTPIDFRAFRGLQRCVLYWRAGSDSLFNVSGLRQLFLHRYSGVESEPLGRLSHLTDLSVANSALEEVTALGELKNLRFLGLYNLKSLRSLRGLGELPQLEELEINGCQKFGTIDAIAALSGLRKLQLNDDGKLASLRPLLSMTKLEELLFYESTNIVDGDLSPLLSLPRLRKVSFQNRRHYSHRREAFADATRHAR